MRVYPSEPLMRTTPGCGPLVKGSVNVAASMTAPLVNFTSTSWHVWRVTRRARTSPPPLGFHWSAVTRPCSSRTNVTLTSTGYGTHRAGPAKKAVSDDGNSLPKRIAGEDESDSVNVMPAKGSKSWVLPTDT